MAKTTYTDSPFGEGIHPHVNKADDKFNKEVPPFHVDLALEGDEAEAFKAKIDKATQDAFNDYMENGEGSKLSAGAKKKWGTYVPYEDEEDKEGNPTGRTLFSFKQNSIIRTSDGKKEIHIGIYDADGNEVRNLVTHGSTIRVRYGFRAIVLKTNQQVGVRMDFSMVQIKELAEGHSGGGFGKVDGGGFKGSSVGTHSGDDAPSTDEDNADY
jgi:hypothetical protein